MPISVNIKYKLAPWYPNKTAKISNTGLTIVELLSVIVISALILAGTYSAFIGQRRTASETQARTEAIIKEWESILPIRWDIFQLGYGCGAIGGTEAGTMGTENIQKYLRIALFIKDGGTYGSDEIFIIDRSFLDDCELMGWDCNVGNSGNWIQLNTRARSVPFLGKIQNINNDKVTIGSIDIEPDPTPLNLDDCSGCNDDPENATDKNEFVSNIYVITDTDDPDKKVARITEVESSDTIKLDGVIEGTYIAPAVRYFVKCNDSDECSLYVQRRSVGGTTHEQELIPGIYDLQVAYASKDDIDNFICSGKQNDECGSKFDPSDMYILRISVIAGVKTYKSQGANIPPLENRKCCSDLNETECQNSSICNWNGSQCTAKNFRNMYFRTITTYTRSRLIDIYNTLYKERTTL